MTLEALIDQLTAHRARVWVEDSQLLLRLPKGVPGELKVQLASHKSELMDYVRQRQHQETVGDAAGQTEPDLERRHEPFPLTDIQQAYWIGRKDAFDLGAVTCHLYMEIESTHVEHQRLEAAWRLLCLRHEMLRAVVDEDGRQRILAETPPYVIEVDDLRGLAQEEADAGLEAVRNRMSHQVIPADQWPLFEIRMSRHGDDLRRIHLSIDLLMVDVGSILRLFEEWQLLYHNLDAQLRPLQFSFRDYVLAEQRLEETDQLRKDWDYWKTRVQSLPPAPQLPLAADPTTMKNVAFERRHLTLPAPLWDSLQAKTKAIGITNSGLLLTAFAEVLATWSKSRHFTINLTLFNRLPFHEDVDTLVGDFTTLTLLEVDHRKPASFIERAQALKLQLWRDLEHRGVSGVKVMRELSRRQSGSVLMPVVFTSALALNTLSEGVTSLNEFGDRIHTITQTPQVWLDHQVFEEDGALSLSWDTVQGLFPDGMVEAMWAAYEELLRGLAVDDNLWHDARLTLTPKEQLEQRARLNEDEQPLSDDFLYAGLVRHARDTPDAVALIAGDKSFTYADLYNRANDYAHQLRRLGATPNQLVAVVMEKGWEQVVASYAIMIAGGAYMPVDPGQPESRIRQLLDDGGCTMIITQAHLRGNIPLPDGVTLLSIRETPSEAQPALEPNHQKHDLAYVIFTSGSTGKPKGVAIEHLGAVNTVLDINNRFNVGPEDRVLCVSSLSFDLSVYDVFGLHFAGGALVMISPDGLKEPSHWLEQLRSHDVTLWNTVPALKQMLVEHVTGLGQRLPDSLRLVMMSGDWIPTGLPDQIRAVCREGLDVISLGGATEASIWSILYPIGAVGADWKSIPYGKPMVNQSFHVLDSRLQPCPIYTTGELFIGGVGLARLYWGDAQKTAERFITHPLDGRRLYRTGDLGRYLPDGDIEFLGREDTQVKIRGYRIELGEIETALQSLPMVKDAAVIAHGPTTNRSLAGYVVLKEAVAVEELKPTDIEGRAVENDDFLQDSRERAGFKLRQHGIRKDLDNRPNIALETPEDEAERWFQRRTHRTFLAEPLSHERFSRFLANLKHYRDPRSPLPKLRYASAGHLFPVQAYLHIKDYAVESLEGGYYYYNPADNSLVQLSQGPAPDADIHQSVNRDVYNNAAFSLFLVAKLDAITPIYGPLARDFCFLEAGYIGQLLMSVASESQMGLCPIGVTHFENLRDHFVIEDADNYILLHSFLSGPVDPSLQGEWDSPAPTKAPTVSPLDQVREALTHKVPDYMIPASFTALEQMPLTGNGKVDRKQLPLPGKVTGGAVRDPDTETGKKLAAIWSEVLEAQVVDADADFFDLGGHSLPATRAVSRIRDTFGVELSLRDFFTHPRLSEMATVVEDLLKRRDTRILPLERIHDEGPAPLSYAQQRLFFMDQLNPDSPQFNMSYGMRLLGPLDREILTRGFQTIVSRHEPLRTNYRLQDGLPVQVINPDKHFSIQFEDLTNIPTEERTQRAADTFRQIALETFDLAEGELFRLKLLKLDDTTHHLLISVHHLNADGWSVGVILKELAVLYADSDAVLPEPPLRYRDFARCQRGWFDQGLMEHVDQYWRKKLAGADILKLPTDRPLPDQPDHQGAVFHTMIPAAQARALETMAGDHDTTLFSVLLAGFKTLLYRLTGQPDLLLGTDAANRNRTELESLVGFFINILPLRTDLSGDPTFAELLKRVRRTVIDAYAHEDMPYDRLVNLLGLKRDRTGAPLIRALFVHQSFPLSGVSLPNLDWALIKNQINHARFDLAVFASGADILGGGDDNADMEVEFLYRGDVFDAETIERIAAQYRNVLTEIIRDPGQTLDAIVLEDAAEQERRRLAKLESKDKKSKSLKRARRSRNRVTDDDRSI